MGTTATAAMQILTAQLGIPKPLSYGYIRAKGNQAILTKLPDTSRVAFYFLGEGPWQSLARLWVNRKRVDWTDTTKYHFHPGTDGILGNGLAPTSIGNDQNADQFFTFLPAGFQPLDFSRLAYLAVHVPADPGAPGPDLEVIGDYMTTQCRFFDAAGNQTNFNFTTNPAWIILDVIIRKMLKPEALANAALTAAEKSRINFASFYAAAQYYDGIVLSGAKRFEISVAFPNQTTVTAMVEQLLLMCRSYIIEEGGQLYLFPDKNRASTFTLTNDHYIPGTLQVDERNLESSANHFVGAYNDLNVPIVSNVGAGGASRTAGVTTLTTTVNHPFLVGDTVNIASMTDPTFLGSFLLTAIPAANQIQFNQVGQPDAVSGNGTVGIDEARFTQRSLIVDNVQHQNAIGQRGLGLATIPNRIELDLDYGNNTGDCVRRLLTFQSVRALGDDNPGYKAPFSIRLKARAESIDAGSNALMEQLRGDLITIDTSVSLEFAGVYEIIEVDFTPASGNTADRYSSSVSSATQSQYVSAAAPNSQDAGICLLVLLQYEPDAFVDGFATITNQALQTTVVFRP